MGEPARKNKLTRPVGIQTNAPVEQVPPDQMAPHSVEAEESLLGSVLLNPDVLSNIAGELTADDFFIVRNGWIWDALINLWQRSESIDNITVAEELKQQKRLEESGGVAYITYLINHTPSSLYTEAYAEILQRAQDRRRWLEFAGKLATEAHAESDNIGTQFTDLLAEFMKLRPRQLNRGLLMSDDVSDRFWQLQSREQEHHKVFPLPWRGATDSGLPWTTGGKVIVWGGDTGTGKTAGCETLVEHWLSLGMNGFYIHTEMTQDDMVLRRYCRRSGIDFIRLETPLKLTQDEQQLREMAEIRIGEWPGRMEFYRDMPLTPDKALAAMHRAVDVFGVDFIVLDQFTSLTWGEGDAQQKYNFVSSVVDFAEQKGVLLLIATQMSNSQFGGRKAWGTSALNDLAALFFDVSRKRLKEPLKFRTDGKVYTLAPGNFDPRIDLNPAKTRFSGSAYIPLFYDGRRLLWRDRDEVEIISSGATDFQDHWSDD